MRFIIGIQEIMGFRLFQRQCPRSRGSSFRSVSYELLNTHIRFIEISRNSIWFWRRCSVNKTVKNESFSIHVEMTRRTKCAYFCVGLEL